MQTPLALLRSVARAFFNAFGAGIAGDILVDVLPEVAKDVWDLWGKTRNSDQQRAEIQALVQASKPEFLQAVATVADEFVSDKAPEVRLALENYLDYMQGSLQQSLRRPSDPEGRSLPPNFTFGKAEDLLTILHAKRPRFKPGDRPLKGVDRELVELLGVGGFGEVWKARNPFFDGQPPVALKFCLDLVAKDRLLRHEAGVLNQVMRQGKHPGIVSLQHTYLSADLPCLEYEFVAGGELAGVIRDSRAQGGLPPPQAGRVTLELARIMGFAHQLNPPIVHRDLKPTNVLMERRPDGTDVYRITDFGIGGLAAGQAIYQSRKGTSRGEFLASSLRGSFTPLYASPQQMRGDDPDPRDDVYSLGVIWYQLLTGDLGTGRPGGKAWHNRLKEKGMTAPLIGLLERWFEDRPEDRPANAGKLAEELERNLKHLHLRSTPPPPPPENNEKKSSVKIDECRITRICWNTKGWKSPSGEACQLERETFVTQYGFGYEEWVFSPHLVFNDWHYGFIQGVNTSAYNNVMNKNLFLLLFTIGPQRLRYLIGFLQCRVLLDKEAAAAYAEFKADGIIAQMVKDVKAIGWNGQFIDTLTQPLGKHLDIFNIQYQSNPKNPFFFQPQLCVPLNHEIYNRFRKYKLFHCNQKEVSRWIQDCGGDSSVLP